MRFIRLFVVLAIVAGLLVVGTPQTTPSAHAALRSEDITWQRAGAVLESQEIVSPLSMVGLTWPDGESPGRAWFRVHQGGDWGPWSPLRVDDDHGPDPATIEATRAKPASDAVWVGAADAVQFRTEQSAEGATAVLIDTTDRTRPLSKRLGQILTPRLPSAAAIPDAPLVLPRSEWDPTSSCVPVDEPDLVQVTHAFVHHTTGTSSYSAESVPSRILGICFFHTQSRGWDDIAYNFLIDQYGRIWEGRAGGIDKGVQGAHTQGFNSYSMGVAYIGDHESSLPTAAAEAALVDLLAWKFGVHNVDPTNVSTLISKGSALWEQGVPVSLYPVSGHRDVQATACPGSACYSHIPQYRGAVDALWNQIPLETFEAPLVGDFDGDGDDEGAIYRATDGVWSVVDTGGEVTVWAEIGTQRSWSDQMVGDFDGDGKDDIAAFSDGTWWVSRSTGLSFNTTMWVDLGTTALWTAHVVGDFDDDGKDDIAGFSDGAWSVHRSTGSHFTTSVWADVGTSTEWTSQIVGDFDGSGGDDIAGFDPSDGTWWVSVSTGSSFTTSMWADFGTPSGWGAQLVGDYNGDTIDDIANYYPANGTWWVSLSNGTTFDTTLWGVTTSEDHLSYFWVQDVDDDGLEDVLAFDAYNGFIKRQQSTGSGFDVLSLIDTPWRTTLAAEQLGRRAGPTAWVYFGQEFQWVRIGDLDAEDATAAVAATLPTTGSLGPRAEISHAIEADVTGDGLSDVVHVGDAVGFRVSVSSGVDFGFDPWADPIPGASWVEFVAGDFDNNGIEDVAGYDQAAGRWWVMLSDGSSFTAESWAQFGTKTGWTARLVGDFNNDGRDDIANYHPILKRWWVSISYGTGFSTTLWAQFGTGSGWSGPLVGDFSGDGRDDIANFHPTLGRWWVSVSTGAGFSTKLWDELGAGGAWVNHVSADFDGNSFADVAVFDETTGEWVVSLSTGVHETLAGFETSVFSTFGTSSGWTAAVTGDFTDDGLDDIANYHPALKRWWVSASTGTAFSSRLWAEFGTGSGWGPHLTGDFSGDDVPDIANFHPGLGRWWVSVSHLDGFSTTKWAEIGPMTPF